MSTLGELSSEFPFNPDTIGGDVLGVGECLIHLPPNESLPILLADQGWIHMSIGNGTRSSSATAYLKPAMARPNLDIVINAQATKLLQTGYSKGLPSFRSVKVTQSAAGERLSNPKPLFQKKKKTQNECLFRHCAHADRS